MAGYPFTIPLDQLQIQLRTRLLRIYWSRCQPELRLLMVVLYFMVTKFRKTPEWRRSGVVHSPEKNFKEISRENITSLEDLNLKGNTLEVIILLSRPPLWPAWSVSNGFRMLIFSFKTYERRLCRQVFRLRENERCHRPKYYLWLGKDVEITCRKYSP